MGNSDNPFEFHESDLYVACVGDNGGTYNFDIREGFKSSVNIMIEAVENGAYEDTMIYPVVYNIRHSIELSMKIIIEYLLHIYNFRKVSFGEEDKKKIYTHDIETLDTIIQKYYSFDRRIKEKYDMVHPYLKDYYFDKKGDVFKYESDHNGNPHLIKLGISSISYDVLKRKYNEMMDLFDNLIFEVMYLCKEYSMGTFTKHLSREDIKDIAKMLPLRKNWCEEEFSTTKATIKQKYSIGSKEFSEALNIIQKHCEFCTYIGMEIKIGDIEENEIREYAKLVMEMNGEDLYNNEIGSRSSDMSGICLGEIQKKARRRRDLSEGISDNTLGLLMMFREYGRTPELFVERRERVLEVSGLQNYHRQDVLKKIEKRDAFRKILLGMKRCGQTSYCQILKGEFSNSSEESKWSNYLI